MKSRKYMVPFAMGLVLTIAAASGAVNAATTSPYHDSVQQADTAYAEALHDTYTTNSQLRDQMQIVMDSAQHGSQINGSMYGAHEKEMTATMSRITGVSAEEIENMHERGLSWNQVAQELGLNMKGEINHTMIGAGNHQTGIDAGYSHSGSQEMHTTVVEHSANGSMGGTLNHASNGNSGNGNATMTQFSGGSFIPNSSAMNYGTGGYRMAAAGDSGNLQGSMHGAGISDAEMAAATMRNTKDGGVSGHGTEANSSIGHDPGSMMSGAGGLDNEMPSDHGSRGGNMDSMSGNSGGMGSSDSGMGGTGGHGGSSGSSGGGMGGNSGGGMGGHGGSGGSGGGGGMM